MRKHAFLAAVGVGALITVGCNGDEEVTVVYQAMPVVQRDIVVSAQAAGIIEPDTTVEVKSKASGEILEIRVETGELVERGTLMVRVDQRTPRNTLAQREAQLEVAQAQLANAEAQKRRADELFKSQSITETEHEKADLDYANAKATVVSAEVQVENARIQMDDTDVRAPIRGTIIEKNVERGQVISSPTSTVGGGTVLLQMADLNLVQVRTLVDETDIGKIQPGMRATVEVAAFPNRPFDGSVLKVEPQAVTQQNVTMFPVLVRIENQDLLLKPGMNAEVELHIGRRDAVLAVANAALRTRGDVSSAASVLGLTMEQVQEQLAQAERPTPDSAVSEASLAAKANGEGGSGPETIEMPNGTTVTLPEGVTAAQVQAIFAKFQSGQRPTAEERALLQKIRGAAGGRSGGHRPGGGRQRSQVDAQMGGQYIVFVLRNGEPTAVNVRTGLTDLDYSEIISGLTETDSVLVLPSASLVRSQERFQERVNRVTGGGGLPGVRSTNSR
ncbi:MAG: efflux RND transporter periplasmic adaptor subunit [Gemmatimonadales bacterium]|nr:efflux RND transporter periplasmic adaptor subunit [Gemmatimonadales bacterium]